MSRSIRADIGKETVAITERGWYEHEVAGRVDISRWVRECLAATMAPAPRDTDDLLLPAAAPSVETAIEVTSETSLAAARRLVANCAEGRVLCLNFASAKNPGGGFLGGSQAQEESLARSSALYASLLTQNSYYDTNRRCGTTLYTDSMILSPNVPVFRDDEGQLLSEPYRLSIPTAPAVNAGAIKANEPEKAALIRPTMARRISKVLSVAAVHGYKDLILGAWGCGVFRNDPSEIATLFREALLEDLRFRNRFHSIVFAIFDVTSNEIIRRPFRNLFELRT